MTKQEKIKKILLGMAECDANIIDEEVIANFMEEVNTCDYCPIYGYCKQLDDSGEFNHEAYGCHDIIIHYLNNSEV